MAVITTFKILSRLEAKVDHYIGRQNLCEYLILYFSRRRFVVKYKVFSLRRSEIGGVQDFETPYVSAFSLPHLQPWYRVTIWENMIYSGPLFYMILYRMNSYYLQARLAQISQNHWFILVFCASTRGIMRVLQYLNISAAYWGRSCCYASYESHVSPLSYAIW